MAEVGAGSSLTSSKKVGLVYALRADAALTSSYVATSHLKSISGEWINLDFLFTWAAATSVEWYVEWSADGTTWYRDTSYSVSAGVATLLASSNTIAVTASVNWNDGPIRCRDNYMRVQAKKTTGAGADSLAISATVIADLGY